MLPLFIFFYPSRVCAQMEDKAGRDKLVRMLKDLKKADGAAATAGAGAAAGAATAADSEADANEEDDD